MCCEVNTANRHSARGKHYFWPQIYRVDKFGSSPHCLSKSYRSASIGPQTSKRVSSNLEPANPAIAETAQQLTPLPTGARTEKWKNGNMDCAVLNIIEQKGFGRNAVMQKVYSVIRKIGLAKTHYGWICSNRCLGFLTLHVDTSQLHLSYAALCLYA